MLDNVIGSSPPVTLIRINTWKVDGWDEECGFLMYKMNALM